MEACHPLAVFTLDIAAVDLLVLLVLATSEKAFVAAIVPRPLTAMAALALRTLAKVLHFHAQTALSLPLVSVRDDRRNIAHRLIPSSCAQLHEFTLFQTIFWLTVFCFLL